EPLWPEAQYNLAMIDKELGNYSDATYHMRCYLELVPNAKDAEAARDNIIIWEEKASKGGQGHRAGVCTVTGEVKNPGDQPCSSTTTVLNAIQAAGGF